MTIPRLIIAAPMSGSGKTTITAGIIAALVKRGLRVAPFKIGPDYIDPTYHTLAAGRPCHNLDAWMIPPDRITASFARRCQGADIAVLEGVMGLFDGYSGKDDTGSTAHVARMLGVPVILVLEVWGMSRSAAAIVRGFCEFDKNVHIAGVILNRVGSETHAALVKDAIETETRVPVLGYLRRDDEIHLPERHLGLVPTAEPGQWQARIEGIQTRLEASLDVDRLLTIATSVPILAELSDDPFAAIPTGIQPVIAVAKDAAFNFIYEDNLDLLRAAGAQIEFFSPLADTTLPPNTQALYLCGGFPEVFAGSLSGNIAMRQAIRAAHQGGMPIYAECGGLMYLTEAICDLGGTTYPMVGLLPGFSAMTPRLKLGYRTFHVLEDTWLWKSGERMRGHEFHHSVWQSRPDALPYLYELQPDALVATPRLEGAHQGQMIASYTHLHFLAYPQLAARFVQAANAFQRDSE